MIKIIQRVRNVSSKISGIGILNTLERYPDQKGTAMYQRSVRKLIEIIYLNPSAVFVSVEKVQGIREDEAIKTLYGIILKILPGEFTSVISFMGFIGTKKAGAYCIQMDLLVDSERQNPTFIYIFSASRGSADPFCKVASLFQSSLQADESQSYKEIKDADIIYHGEMAMRLAKTFHLLSSLSMPAQVAAACGVIGLSSVFEYRC